MKLRSFTKALITILTSELVGIVGALITTPSLTSWYSQLNKPALTPPARVFGPVWTLLYLLMGIAAFLVWKKGLSSRGVKQGLALFSIQLGLNLLWSFIFFGLQAPFIAFLEIIVLWFCILGTLILFFKVTRVAGILLIPYLLWVSFAGYLTLSIYLLNF